jgi:signal transduction histidine kinase
MHVEQQRSDRPGEPAHSPVDTVMSASFVVLLVAAMSRFLIRHPGAPDTPYVIALTAVLAVAYVLRPADRERPAARWPKAWLAVFTAAWAALVVLAPSFAWSAVPLVYTALRLLTARAALVLVALLTVFVVVAQVRISGTDPLLILGPPAVAILASAVFLHMQRQSERQRVLIDDLIATRAGLAASERRAGTLEERQRLSMEIHDTLAQGLSSQQMLLQAAERVWDTDPATARNHVGTASGIAERNLAEARRFVHDLAPADLADGGGLEQALRTLADRTSRQGVATRFRTDGASVVLPARVEAALLRVAQGAIANVCEHAGASAATVTLTYLGDDVVLDIADNGAGFDPDAPRTGGPGSAESRRGHGLPAMEARLRQLAGTLTVESAPGDGTVVSAWVPLGEGRNDAQ